MREQERYDLAIIAAETMYHLWELEYQQGELDLDGLMKRLKDLSAYSLTHAEIMNQREGVELLALGMLFGMTSNPRLHKNQERLGLLSEETIAYQGQAEIIEQEVAMRKAGKSQQEKDDEVSDFAATPHAPVYLIALCAADEAALPSPDEGLSLFDDAPESVYAHYYHEIRKNMAAGELLADLEREIAELRAGAEAGAGRPWWRRLLGRP